MSSETFWDSSCVNANTWMIENISSVLSLGFVSWIVVVKNPQQSFYLKPVI